MLAAPMSAPTIATPDDVKNITWKGVYDLADITKSFSLPILVRALESHYGNSDLSAFSRLDVLKIHKAVVVDLVLATFNKSGIKHGPTGKGGTNLTVDMADSSVQICFPKDFCGLFQVSVFIHEIM